jgi:hypothetical protein
MQAHIQARFTEQQGRALWHSMFAEVNGQGLTAPSWTWTLVKLAILFPLLGVTLALSWSQSSFWVLGAAAQLPPVRAYSTPRAAICCGYCATLAAITPERTSSTGV